VLALGVLLEIFLRLAHRFVRVRARPAFFWEAVFVDVFVMAILAISYNLMFGFAGVVSFGHAAFFGLGAYNVGLLMQHLHWPWWLAILVTLLVGAVIALVKGVVGLRIKGLYFALFTLALAEIPFVWRQPPTGEHHRRGGRFQLQCPTG
jgi:branched-chain amino acid transport system permease protein